jgi:hypothetical protein
MIRAPPGRSICGRGTSFWQNTLIVVPTCKREGKDERHSDTSAGGTFLYGTHGWERMSSIPYDDIALSPNYRQDGLVCLANPCSNVACVGYALQPVPSNGDRHAYRAAEHHSCSDHHRDAAWGLPAVGVS